jgi:hypothetical protein
MKDYRSMEAGPEMDLAVWRAVMAHSDSDAFIEDRAEHLAPGEKPHLVVCWELEGGSFERWSPSSNIAHAMEVVENIGYQFMTHMYGPFCLSMHDHNGTWFASFGAHHSGECATPAYAICRAVLLAKSAP